MSNRDKIRKKIIKVRAKLLKACLEHDEPRMIKLQHKLLKLNLKRD